MLFIPLSFISCFTNAQCGHHWQHGQHRADVGSVVEWLKRQARDQNGLGSKSTRAILLCPWERYFTAYSPAWWSWQAVLNYSYISIKLQADSNILASPEAGRGNCLPYVLAPPSLFLRVRRINIEINKKINKKIYAKRAAAYRGPPC